MARWVIQTSVSHRMNHNILFSHRVGIISLKSSPGGQSFSFNTMGCSSVPFRRSADTNKGPAISQKHHGLNRNQLSELKGSTWRVTHWRGSRNRRRSLWPWHRRWWHSFYSWPDLRPDLQTPGWMLQGSTSGLSDAYVSLTPTQAGGEKEKTKVQHHRGIWSDFI